MQHVSFLFILNDRELIRPSTIEPFREYPTDISGRCAHIRDFHDFFEVFFSFGCSLEVGRLSWLFPSSGIAFSDKRGTMVLRLLPVAGWVPMSNSKNPT